MTVAWVVVIAISAAGLGVLGTLLVVVPPVLRAIRRENEAHRAQLEEGVRRTIGAHLELPAQRRQHLRLVSNMGRTVGVFALATVPDLARRAVVVLRDHPVQAAAAGSAALTLVTSSVVLLPVETPTPVPDASRSHAPPTAPSFPRQTLPDRHSKGKPAPAPSSNPQQPPQPVDAEPVDHRADAPRSPRRAVDTDADVDVDVEVAEPDAPDTPSVPGPTDPHMPDDPEQPSPDEDGPAVEVGCDDPGLCVNVDVGDVLATEVKLGLPSPDSQSRIYAHASRTSRYAVTA